MRNIQLFIGLLLIPFVGISQNTYKQTLQIRAEFQRINTNDQLEKIDLYNEEFMEQTTDGGGQLTGYFEKGRLVKYTEWIGTTYGTLITDYYLKEGKLFFAYRQESKFVDVYDNSGEWISLNTNKQEIKFEGRYYFDGSELIKEIINGKRIFNQSFELKKFLKHAYATAGILSKTKEK